MSETARSFSFESIGCSLDAFISNVGSRAAAVMPKPEYVKTTVKNVVPRIHGKFSVDLTETDDAFILACDLPGFTKEDVSVKLVEGKTIIVEAKICSETVSSGTYHLRERRIASGKRTIILPEEVTAAGAAASFKHGVLEVVLLKTAPVEGEEIPVE